MNKLFKKVKEILSDPKKMEAISYLFFGVLTTGVNFAVYLVLTRPLGMDEMYANPIAIFSAIVFAFFTNRTYVFHSKETNLIKEFIKFLSGRLVTMLLDQGIMFVGVKVLFINDLIVKVAGQVVNIVGNYVISKLFVFKNKKA